MSRVALVTGVSRPIAIGAAVARRLLTDGLRVAVHGRAEHDAENGFGEAGDAAGLRELLGEDVLVLAGDLTDPEVPRRLLDEAAGQLGRVDVVVAAHAHGTQGGLEAVTAAELDRAFAVNARGSVLLVQALAAARRADRAPGGRVVLFTSGQGREPMPDELAYAVSKGAIAAMVPTLADAVADLGITVNAINPGPNDTGWPDDELRARLAPAFPAGRWGRPEDIAPVVSFLASEESAWLTGQVLDVEGGFRRHAG